MNHSHVLFDTDNPFRIDPISRNIINESSSKVRLIQHDHNSERFSFIVPQFVEGHDLKNCNVVEVHYLNIEANTKNTKRGVYRIPIADIQFKDDESETLVCSWLISRNATQYAGMLSFLIRFSCVLDDGTLEYAWNTAPYNGISIVSGIYNTEAVEEEYIDVLTEWERELKSNHIVRLEQTTVGEGDGDENIWTATFGDGRTQELKVKNGSRGPTGLVGSIETREGNRLDFSVCSTETYNALSKEEQANLIAFCPDDDELDLENLFGKDLEFGGFYNKGITETEMHQYFSTGVYRVTCSYTANKISYYYASICYIIPYIQRFASGDLEYLIDLGININGNSISLHLRDQEVSMSLPSYTEGVETGYLNLKLQKIS